MSRPWTWEGLAQATLRRQLPRAVEGAGAAQVAELVRRTGPVQSQVARSLHVGIAARLPGVHRHHVEEAYAARELVRGSSIRGTVHTSTADQHELLDAVTRPAQAASWRAALGLEAVDVVQVHAELERFAAGARRTPDELREHLVTWATQVRGRPPPSTRPPAHTHSALLREPRSGAGWDRQTAPVYRLADEVLGRDRSAVVADPQAALADLCRGHVRWHGPSSRQDVAWWSGARLRDVDRALAAVGEELVGRAGPDGRTYLDLAEGVPAVDPDPSPRLLAEFDALVVGYEPRGRVRFADPEHLPWYWTRANGLYACVLLLDGRLAASWRLGGTGSRRVVEVRTFPGARAVDPGDLTDQVRALEAVLACEVTDVRVTRAADTP